MSGRTIEYLNYDYIPAPKGAVNSGVVCHFNSLIQSLISCTSLTNYMKECEKKLQEEREKVSQGLVVNKEALEMIDSEHSKTFHKYIEVLRMQLNPEEKYLDTSQLLATLGTPNNRFGSGMEDIGEGFTLLMDALDNKVVNDNFRCVYKRSLYCSNCTRVVEEVLEEPSLYIGIPPLVLVPKTFQNGVTKQILRNRDTMEFITRINNLNRHPLNRYIKQIKARTDRKCPSCGEASCVNAFQLNNSPNVLVILIKKYGRKQLLDFPQTMDFTAEADGKEILRHYKLVAQAEHLGNRRGGHYYADCLRKGGYYRMNDTRYSPIDPMPTPNSYMLFYHIYDPNAEVPPANTNATEANATEVPPANTNPTETAKNTNPTETAKNTNPTETTSKTTSKTPDNQDNPEDDYVKVDEKILKMAMEKLGIKQ